jgi:putative endonuclease
VSEVRRRRGTDARRSGRRAEVLAALWLMFKGYRVLGFRLRTPQAEIDLLVARRGVLAAVEVKSRTTAQAALEAVGYPQRERLRRALAGVAARKRGFETARLRLDLLALAPGHFPRHIPDAWSEDGDVG